MKHFKIKVLFIFKCQVCPPGTISHQWKIRKGLEAWFVGPPPTYIHFNLFHTKHQQEIYFCDYARVTQELILLPLHLPPLPRQGGCFLSLFPDGLRDVEGCGQGFKAFIQPFYIILNSPEVRIHSRIT